MGEGLLHDYASKASFDRLYELPDPRPYSGTLGRIDYRKPDLYLPRPAEEANEPPEALLAPA